MVKLVTCSICGRFFELNGFRAVCPNCIEKDMNEFNRIRDYLYVHPRAKIFEVSTNLDIPVPVIKRYLREGRLEIIEKQNLFLKCEKCGKPVCSGTQCEDCQKQSAHDFKTAFAGSALGKGKISYLSPSRK